MSAALEHCGYEGADMEDGGFEMKLTTPYEGASVEASITPAYRFPAGQADGRTWGFSCRVRNNRGIGWHFTGTFDDCGRFVAKSMLRSMALQLRRAYCHRGQKIRKRAVARAKAQEGGAE